MMVPCAIPNKTTSFFAIHCEVDVEKCFNNRSFVTNPHKDELGGGFKDCLFLSLPGEMIQFDRCFFQMG